MLVGGEVFPYDVHRFLITSLDLPANSEVISASPETPCLGLALKLDLRIMAELIAQGSLPMPTERSNEAKHQHRAWYGHAGAAGSLQTPSGFAR